jgi:hypothetical protein
MLDLIVHDRELAQSIGDGVLLGRSFAFLSDKVFAHPALAWVTTLFGPSARGPKIVPLGLGRTTAIPGVAVRGPDLPALSLRLVVSDKSVYREERMRCTSAPCIFRTGVARPP